VTPLPLPPKVVGTYFQLYTGGIRITAVPASYNLIYLFQADRGSGGAYQFGNGNAVSAAEIATCRGRGQRVVLTIGGANAGFNYQTRAQSQALVDSIKKMVTQLGGELDGADFNNFEANIGSSPAEMTWIAQQLKATYGPNFSITCPPAPGAGYAPGDRVLTKAMADACVLDYAGPQFYDSSDLTTEAIVEQLIQEWVKNLGSASRVVIGAGANYSSGGSTATTVAAWKKLVAQYPDLRGVFGWSAQDDSAKGWSFGTAIAAAVGSSPAPAPPAPTPPAPTPPTPPAPTPPAPTPPAPTPPPPGKVVFDASQPQRTGFTRATDTLRCTAVFTNGGSTSVTLKEAWITSRPPGGTHGGGPFNGLTPSATNVVVRPGQSYAVNASRRFQSGDKLEQWEV
jgi:chitinase